ncbi:hypothetical protein PP645_001488 [Vibrio vulnificus]|nr:hypothetical protein [Vibrio vulnificus]
MKVIFSHGKESGPWGSKIKRLANTAERFGYQVDSIDYTDILDPDLRVERLLDALSDTSEDVILVGSSMGGYVSLVASEAMTVKGVFLLAPALYMSGYNKQEYQCRTHVEVVHGWSDDVIPVEHSIKFAKATHTALHLIAGDHRLKSSIDEVDALFAQFLNALAKIDTR